MARGLNLKAVFSADTTGLKKGAREATEALRAFENESSGAIDALGSALGVNVDQLKRLSKAGEGAGLIMANSFGKANTSATALFGTMGAIAGGVGALAVGAAVASWRDLNEQADYFYNNSKQGAIALAGLNAYTETMKGILQEMNDPEAAAEMTSSWKKTWSNIFGFYRAQLQIFRNDLKEFNFTKDADERGAEAAIQVYEAKKIAEQADVTAKKLKDAQLKWAEVQAGILADKKIEFETERAAAKDINLSVEERARHQRRAIELVQEMAAIEKQYRTDIIALSEQAASYTEYSFKQEMEILELKQQAKRVEASYISQLKEVRENEKAITDEIRRQIEERRKRAENYALTSTTDTLDNMTMDDWVPIPYEELGNEAKEFYKELNAGITKTSFNLEKMDLSAARAIDALRTGRAVADEINKSFSGLINSALSGMSDLIGQTVAGTTNLGQGLLSLLGDIMVQLGEVAISAGMGMLAIKKAFESLNPYLAISAGAALIALGSAISNSVSSLSNNIGAASGGYTIGSGSSSNYASTLNRAPSAEPVEVTGRFEIRGDDLVAVIGRNQKRKSYVG